ncbi:hypothetical protein ABKA04_002480 [Annulohypoxylon sp. FPYF3050]
MPPGLENSCWYIPDEGDGNARDDDDYRDVSFAGLRDRDESPSAPRSRRGDSRSPSCDGNRGGRSARGGGRRDRRLGSGQRGRVTTGGFQIQNREPSPIHSVDLKRVRAAIKTHTKRRPPCPKSSLKPCTMALASLSLPNNRIATMTNYDRCAQPVLGDEEPSTTEPPPDDGGPTGVATDGPAMADLYTSQMEQRREMQDEIREIRGERDEEQTGAKGGGKPKTINFGD